MEENKKIKIVIIGGSIAGLSAATRARRINEYAEISIIDESKYIGIPLSGLPAYASGVLSNKETLLIGNEDRIKNIYNINIYKYHSAYEINLEKKEVYVKNLSTGKTFELNYDKLILATGNKYNLPKLQKRKISNLFFLRNIEDAIEIRDFIDKTSAKDITIAGSNLLSLITIGNLIKKGFNVTLIENNQIISNDFDEEFSYIIYDELIKNGVDIYLNSSIKDYIKIDRERINKIKLDNGAIINTHMIIFFPHIIPNTDLIKKLNLDRGDSDRIKVNEKMQTSNYNVFAAGNIAEANNYITKKPFTGYLTGASTQQQARVAGSVAAGKTSSFKGVLESKIIVLKNLTVGIVGLTLSNAKKLGYDVMPVTIYTGSHERFIPGSFQIHLKIIVNKEDRKILGAQVSGKGEGVDKRLDTLSTAINSSMTVDDLINLDLCYSPGVSTSKDPINILGMVAADRLDGLSNAVELENIKFENNPFILDVRNKKDYISSHIQNSKWIPLNELRSRINELPKDAYIYVYGYVGLQGYIAERILKGNGFEHVFNIEGGITSVKLMENMRTKTIKNFNIN